VAIADALYSLPKKRLMLKVFHDGHSGGAGLGFQNWREREGWIAGLIKAHFGMVLSKKFLSASSCGAFKNRSIEASVLHSLEAPDVSVASGYFA
jgi:hypothetical protein